MDELLDRLDVLIEQGEAIRDEKAVDGEKPVNTDSRTTDVVKISAASFIDWKSNCATLIDDLLPEDSPQRYLLARIEDLASETGACEFLVTQLRKLRDEWGPKQA